MNEANPNPSLEERMLEHRYLIFAPKGMKDLRVYYPELLEYPECKPQTIKHHDLLFAWWYSCQASPLYDADEAVKMEECIHISYPNAQQRAAKLAEYQGKIPDNVKAVMKRMESFNVAARVENYVQTKVVRKNCNEMLATPTDTMLDEEKDAWATRAPKLWKLLDETTKTLERGAFGVSTHEETSLGEADGTLRAFRQARR